MEVTQANFNSNVLNSKKPVIVDFWAAWCGPCKMLAPVFEKVSKEVADIDFVKCDVDANGELSNGLGVRSIPTLVIFKNGKEAARYSGYMSADALKSWIESVK